MFTVTFLRDIVERSAWTFVQAFAAAWLVFDRELALDNDTLKTALIAGAIAVAKGIVASRIGNEESAATLPAEGASE